MRCSLSWPRHFFPHLETMTEELYIVIPMSLFKLNITDTERFVLAYLDYLYTKVSKGKPVYCYGKKLAELLNRDEKSIRKAILDLRDKGLIEVTKEKYKYGCRYLYTVPNDIRETPTVANAASRVEETPAKEETVTSTPSWMEKEIDRLLMPAVSYNYHELKDKEFKTVIKYLSPMKNVGYFRQKCKSMRDNPIILTPQWAGLAKNHIEAHPNDFISPFLEYTIEQSDDRIKAAAIR